MAAIKYIDTTLDSSFRRRPESSGNTNQNDALDTSIRRYDDKYKIQP